MTISITCQPTYFEPQRHYNTNLDPLEELSAFYCDNSYPPYHYDADFDPLVEFSAFKWTGHENEYKSCHKNLGAHLASSVIVTRS